jgi:hypothetical protein
VPVVAAEDGGVEVERKKNNKINRGGKEIWIVQY